jgi:predicted AAA+ superfamily ATPase
MAHERSRYLKASVIKASGMSPIVGILGHRQVGKTTLLGNVCTKYFVLDQKDEREAAQADPSGYLKTRAGRLVALDECQTVPDLFPALKEHVRKKKMPGQFILSGSVRFTSKESIRESLTGRVSYFELLPFSVSELLGRPLPDFCVRALESIDFSNFRPEALTQKELELRAEQIPLSFKKGGLPGVCFIRDDKLREQKIEDQLHTVLDRDLRMVQKIFISYTDILALVRILARMQGEPISFSELRKETGISVPAIKKIIYALEAVFVLRTVKIEGSTKGHVLFFEDQAEWAYLSETKATLLQQVTHFCFTDLRTQFAYRLGAYTRCFQFQTRAGAMVPICFSNAGGTLGILPTLNPEEAQQRHSGSIRSFLSAYPNSKLLVVHLNEKLPMQKLNSRTLLVPLCMMV